MSSAKKKLSERDKEKFTLAEANLKLLEKNEENEKQKMALAEANLRLLEQREELESQKIKLAEANLKLLEYNEIIQREKTRSEELLLNVLPRKVANDLKEKGRTSPESFENVTVFFSDIVNFTAISENISPATLIAELNGIFTFFDKAFRKNGCERIKTIGDAYLCVCGMPEHNQKHAENIIETAIEIMEFLKKRNMTSKHKWQIRAGVHSGCVVGGVVGVEKYIYDVFGDTINTASRMESYSEPMKINISETTRSLIKDKFELEARPVIRIKGKGLLKTYFVKY